MAIAALRVSVRKANKWPPGPILLLTAVVAAVSLAACLARALAPVINDAEIRLLTVGGVERTYYLHVPAGLPSGTPLVIMLHGDFNDGRTAARTYGWVHQSDLSGFVLAGPNGARVDPGGRPSHRNLRGWNSGVIDEPLGRTRSDDVGFIVAMIDDIARTARIDRRRVYLAGYSSGGHMANRLGQEIAGRLAAVSTSGGLFVQLPRPPSRGIPIMISAGDRDPHAPMEMSWRVMPNGGVVVKESQRDIVDHWRTLNACPPAHPVPSPQGTTMEVSGPCRDGSEVRYLVMYGVPHTWATGRPVDLTEMSWGFFQRFSLPAEPEGN